MELKEQQSVTALVFAYIWCLGLNENYSAFAKAKKEKRTDLQREILTKYPHIEEIYEDFGDVQYFRKLSTKERLNFIQGISHLFTRAETSKHYFRVSVDVGGEISYQRSSAKKQTNYQKLVLELPLATSKTALINKLKKMVDTIYDDKEFDNCLLKLRPKYELKCRINQHSFRRVWKSFHIRELFESLQSKNSKNKTKLVAKKLLEQKRKKVVRGILKHPYYPEDLLDFDSYNEKMRTQLNRYRKDGEALIESTITKQFPSY